MSWQLGNLEAVTALIIGGCDVDAVVRSPGQPIDGLSALLIATRQGHSGVVTAPAKTNNQVEPHHCAWSLTWASAYAWAYYVFEDQQSK
jgi:hypothetical protein